MFPSGWASAAVKYLGWFSASCRAKARSQPHLSCVSHLSCVGNPRSRPCRVGLLLAGQGEMPVLQQPVQDKTPEIPGLHGFPSLASQAANFRSARKRRLCPAPHKLLKAFGSHTDTSLPSVTAAGAAENLKSGIQRAAPGSAAQSLALAPSSVAPAWERFPGSSTEHRLAPSHPASESTATGELG